MDAEMSQKIEAVLDRVKEPESRLTIAQLGLVKKVRYNKVRRKLSVFINTINPSKCGCTVISALLLSTTLKALTKEFKKQFPNLGIEVI
jgi:metal-sulfur cluster biosynthetic enzyme